MTVPEWATFDSLARALGRLERAGLFVAGAAFIAMMLVTVADVVMRYLFNSPLTWSFDLITNYLMAAGFFLAVSATQARRQHVNVDVLARLMPDRLRAAIMAAAGVAVVILFALIWWTGAVQFWEAWSKGLVLDGTIPWPRWPTYLLIPLGLTLMVPRLLLDLAGDFAAAWFGGTAHRFASHRRGGDGH